MLGSLLAGFSRSIIELIILRGVAGAGGGGIISIAQIVISDVVTLRDRCVLTILTFKRSLDSVICDLYISEGNTRELSVL